MGLIGVLASLSILGATSLLAALAGRHDRTALRVGAVGTMVGCAGGLVASGWALLSGEVRTVVAPWSLPVGTLSLGIDPLSAFFLLVVFLVAGLSALYGLGYFAHDAGRRPLAAVASLSPLLVVSMAGVILARDAVVFLVAWEAMTLSSFFLVAFEGEHPEVRRAAVVYLLASQLGVVPLFLMFLFLGNAMGGTQFVAFGMGVTPALAGLAFLLALAGFGTKAGFWPMHAWLPEAHPAAPSPVSAVMSGALIKTGLYGLLRVVTLMPPPPAWWGVALLAVGAVSALGGILHALAQRDLKRLLAWCSIENVGVVALGAGLGLLGQAWGDPVVSFLGYAGAVLHVLNHALAKGLLFHGAGAILHATGTRDLDELGGLFRRLPVTGATFLAGSLAISGMPPFNGFVSELLILVAAFRGAAMLPVEGAVPALAVVPILATVGGFSVATFVKSFGIAFLGEPRTSAAAAAREGPVAMRAAMVVGAALCLLIGLAPITLLPLVAPVATMLSRAGGMPSLVTSILLGVTVAAVALAVLVLALVLLRRALLRGRDVRAAATWGCGYEAPTARMQYTAPSFADPVLGPSLAVLDRRVHDDGPRGLFPTRGRFEEILGDLAADRVYRPAYRWISGVLSRLEHFHDGRVQRYLVYVLATLVILLAWQLGHG